MMEPEKHLSANAIKCVPGQQSVNTGNKNTFKSYRWNIVTFLAVGLKKSEREQRWHDADKETWKKKFPGLFAHSLLGVMAWERSWWDSSLWPLRYRCDALTKATVIENRSFLVDPSMSLSAVFTWDQIDIYPGTKINSVNLVTWF